MSTPAPTSKNATRQRDDALTERQHLVLDAIRKHIAEQGFAPSFREIGEAVGLKSPSSVKHQLHALERKGYLHISANKGRAIELYDSGTDSQTATVLPFPGDTEASESILASRDVPLVGRIAAGVPITAEQHIDDGRRHLRRRLRGHTRTAVRSQRRHRGRVARRRGHDQDVPQGQWPHLADTA